MLVMYTPEARSTVRVSQSPAKICGAGIGSFGERSLCLTRHRVLTLFNLKNNQTKTYDHIS